MVPSCQILPKNIDHDALVKKIKIIEYPSHQNISNVVIKNEVNLEEVLIISSTY